jgi:hypothetical protein
MDTSDQALQLFGCADKNANEGAGKINTQGQWEFIESSTTEKIRQAVCIGTIGGMFRSPHLLRRG